MQITVNDMPHENATPATWSTGQNVVRVKVGAGRAAQIYTVIVTKTA